MDALESSWQRVRSTASELVQMCPLDGCEEDACLDEVYGHFTRCIASLVEVFFQIADFAAMRKFHGDDSDMTDLGWIQLLRLRLGDSGWEYCILSSKWNENFKVSSHRSKEKFPVL